MEQIDSHWTDITFCVHIKQPLSPGDKQIAVNKYYIIIKIIIIIIIIIIFKKFLIVYFSEFYREKKASSISEMNDG